MIVFVLGIGESRLRYKPGDIRSRGIFYGCNAICRDFSPDFLVSIDRHMVDEIIASGSADSHTCYFTLSEYGNPIPNQCLVGEYSKTQ